MGKLDDAERLEPSSSDDWGSWLERNHASAAGVWLVTAKKSTGRQQLDYETAVCEALRFGWVDSVQRRVDEERSMLWFAPRSPRSGWSRTNKVRIERLEAQGRLEEPGRAAVERARANGSWEMLDEVQDTVVPDDLNQAFTERPGSREQWEAFPPGVRRSILGWIVQAKRPETRRRRVIETADKAARGERAHQWVPRDRS